ncbi:MAG: hypothetical protein ACRDVE_02470 [Actinocrinis sp.]
MNTVTDTAATATTNPVTSTVTAGRRPSAARGSGPRTASVIELELAAEAGPGWLGSGAEPVTVNLIAESVRFEGGELQFMTGNAVVRRVPRAEVTALTWRGSPPRGKATGPHRNAGAVWTDDERARLTAEVLGNLTWLDISHRHGRTTSAVRREAVQLRLVDELGRRLDDPPALGAGLGHTPTSALAAQPAGSGQDRRSGARSGL